MSLFVALGIGGLVLVAGAWLHYLWLIPNERVPVKPHFHRGAMLLGGGLSIASIAMAPATLLPWLLAVASLPLAAFFFYLLARARQPAATPTFEIGGALPPISGTTEAGASWSSVELAGKRTLVKLFRGHW